MKHSNFALAILSAIILSACGSSSSNDNQSVDPTPSPTPNQNSNSNPTPTPTPAKPISPAANPNPESIPQQQSSSNANNNQPISSQTTPIVKAKPNPKTAGGSKQKQNKGAGNGATASNSTIKAPEAIDIDKLTKTEAETLVKNATEKAQNAEIARKSAENERDAAFAAFGLFSTKLAQATHNLNNASAADVPRRQKEFENAKKAYEDQATKLAEANKKLAEEAAKKLMADKEKELAENAQKYVEEKPIDPEAVIDATVAKQKALQTAAETKELEEKKAALINEANVIKAQKEALKDVKDLYDLTASNASDDKAKETAKDEAKKYEDQIAKLEKEEKAKRDEAEKLDIPIEQAKVVSNKATNKSAEAEKNTKYRGVYSSTGTYDESTSYKDVKKITATGSTASDFSWQKKWVLSIKDGDKTVKLDLNSLPSKLDNNSNPYALFDSDKNILVAENSSHSIYGYVGDNFFSAGRVTENIPTADLDIIYTGSSRNQANRAFLKTNDNKDVIAEVEAKANFAKKEFSGKFKGFKQYTTVSTNGAIGSVVSSLPTEVKFEADVKGNKFVPKDGQDAKNAKVYGYFYGSVAHEAAGLVDHKDFHGAFGVRK